MGDLHWKTAITKIKPNEIRIRGYRIDELMGNVTFAQGVWLTLMGELPSKEIGDLVDSILVSSIDHGPTPPSVLAALTVASGGAAIEPCLAGGLLAISKSHGGAVEACMCTLTEAVKRCDELGKQPEELAGEMLAEFKESGKRISGYGHRIHTLDPRKDRLFELADKAGVMGKHIAMARAFEKKLEKGEKKIPLNVDGAIAACLCELEVPIFLANAFFLIARSVGIIAHVHEERTRYGPMRRIDPVDHEYDGPEDRSLA
jgi:citrate synthase